MLILKGTWAPHVFNTSHPCSDYKESAPPQASPPPPPQAPQPGVEVARVVVRDREWGEEWDCPSRGERLAKGLQPEEVGAPLTHSTALSSTAPLLHCTSPPLPCTPPPGAPHPGLPGLLHGPPARGPAPRPAPLPAADLPAPGGRLAHGPRGPGGQGGPGGCPGGRHDQAHHSHQARRQVRSGQAAASEEDSLA